MNRDKGFALVGVLLVAVVVIVAGSIWYYYTSHPSQNPLLSASHQKPTPNLFQAANISDANNQFSFDLYQRYVSEKGSNENIFFSPFGISSAMAMVYEGAKGQTAQEIANVFHFPADINQLRNGYRSVFNSIDSNSNDYALSTANALWVQTNYQLLSSYTDTIKNYYGGNIANLDFINNPTEAASTINQWVANQTNNKIKNILSPDAINEYTRLILTNAIYFKGAWSSPFEKYATQNKDFTLGDGTHAQVPTMEQTANFAYTDVGDAQFLELPYGQSQGVSMFVLLPKGNNLSAFENELTYQKINNWEKELNGNLVDVSLPKFHIETQADMP